MDTRKKLNDYLKCFQGDNEPGLLVCDHPEAAPEVAAMLSEARYAKCDSWQKVCDCLEKGAPGYMVLDKSFCSEQYQVLRQLVEPSGYLEVWDCKSHAVRQVRFDARKVSLILLATSEALESIERDWQVIELAGMVERF